MPSYKAFKIDVRMNNAAFRNDDDAPMEGCEMARILRSIANQIDEASLEYGDMWHLKDINGNTVGTAKVIKRR